MCVNKILNEIIISNHPQMDAALAAPSAPSEYLTFGN